MKLTCNEHEILILSKESHRPAFNKGSSITRTEMNIACQNHSSLSGRCLPLRWLINNGEEPEAST